MATAQPIVLQAQDLVRCPHCNATQEGRADEYVIPGRMGPASRFRDRCDSCDEVFVVERTPEDQFLVTRA